MSTASRTGTTPHADARLLRVGSSQLSVVNERHHVSNIQLAASAAQSPFDEIRRVRDDGSEYWSARDLMTPLGYDKWQNFIRPIKEARKAASIVAAQDHFTDTSKKVRLGSGAQREVADVEMTRYGAYMVVMACDGRKPVIAEAKSYFAVQTRRAELTPAEPAHAAITVTGVPRVDAALAEAKLLHSFQGLIQADHLEARARIALARGLGETPQLEAAATPIYASDVVAAQGISESDQKRVLSQFGKRAKAAYTLKHGTEPGMYPQTLPNGQVREVRAYTEADRPLLQRVWDEYFAPKFQAAT